MDWRAERYTSRTDTIGLSDNQTYGHRVFQQPALAGRLHWASTETSPVAAGHIEGALTAGDRAADAIATTRTRETTT